jgi:hypothetical protein
MRAPSYVTVMGISLALAWPPDAVACRWKVDAVTVAGAIDSVNVAVTFVVTATPVAPAAGDILATAGATVSLAAVVFNTTSTQ